MVYIANSNTPVIQAVIILFISSIIIATINIEQMGVNSKALFLLPFVRYCDSPHDGHGLIRKHKSFQTN